MKKKTIWQVFKLGFFYMTKSRPTRVSSLAVRGNKVGFVETCSDVIVARFCNYCELCLPVT